MVPLKQITTTTMPLMRPAHRWMSLNSFRVFCHVVFFRVVLAIVVQLGLERPSASSSVNDSALGLFSWLVNADVLVARLVNQFGAYSHFAGIGFKYVNVSVLSNR